jgi:cold shock CspA family protein
MRGTVVEFDEHKGYGTVRDGTDGRELFFHCTQIADGSRTIAPGTEVTFDVVAGHLGRWEAIAITRQG